jgi:hypothetical protein
MIRKLAIASLISAMTLVPATAVMAVPLDVSSNLPSFNNPNGDDLGADAVVGTTIDYDAVLTTGGITVDARITVLTVDGSIDVVDHSPFYDPTVDPFIFSQLRFQSSEVGSGKVRYRIEFTDSATGAPVVVSGLSVSVRDVDETQYIQASNVSSYSLSSSPATELQVRIPSTDPSVRVGEIRFASPSIGIDPEDEDYWVQLNFTDVSAFEVELGQGDYDLDEGAYYYLDFERSSWATTPTETVTPSLAAANDLAETGVSGSSLSLIAMGAVGLLGAAVAIRRRTSSVRG